MRRIHPEIQAAVDRVMSGVPVSTVAREDGVHPSTLFRRLKAAGLKPPVQGLRGWKKGRKRGPKVKPAEPATEG